MSQIRIPNGNRFIRSLKKAKKKFRIRITNSTIIIEFGGNEYRYSEGQKDLNFKELGFIKEVKNYCSKNCTGVHFDRSKIKYIEQGRAKTNYNYKKDVYEIDLNQAYWNFSKNKNYISDEIYTKGLSVSKTCRLISLGNLAKKETILNFDGLEFDKPETIKSEATEGVFFDVSYETDKIMRQLMALTTSNFLFYWVDAIFIQGENALNRVKWYLDNSKIPYKQKDIYKVKREKDRVIIWDDPFAKEGENGTRVFNFKKSTNVKLYEEEQNEAHDKWIKAVKEKKQIANFENDNRGKDTTINKRTTKNSVSIQLQLI